MILVSVKQCIKTIRARSQQIHLQATRFKANQFWLDNFVILVKVLRLPLRHNLTAILKITVVLNKLI